MPAQRSSHKAAVLNAHLPDPPPLLHADKRVQVYLELGLAETAFKAAGERTLGDRTIVPTPTSQLGRIEIGGRPPGAVRGAEEAAGHCRMRSGGPLRRSSHAVAPATLQL